VHVRMFHIHALTNSWRLPTRHTVCTQQRPLLHPSQQIQYVSQGLPPTPPPKSQSYTDMHTLFVHPLPQHFLNWLLPSLHKSDAQQCQLQVSSRSCRTRPPAATHITARWQSLPCRTAFCHSDFSSIRWCDCV
jgi:hypothetical protein